MGCNASPSSTSQTKADWRKTTHRFATSIYPGRAQCSPYAERPTLHSSGGWCGWCRYSTATPCLAAPGNRRVGILNEWLRQNAEQIMPGPSTGSAGSAGEPDVQPHLVAGAPVGGDATARLAPVGASGGGSAASEHQRVVYWLSKPGCMLKQPRQNSGPLRLSRLILRVSVVGVRRRPAHTPFRGRNYRRLPMSFPAPLQL